MKNYQNCPSSPQTTDEAEFCRSNARRTAQSATVVFSDARLRCSSSGSRRSSTICREICELIRAFYNK